MRNIQRILDKAIYSLVTREPFWGTLALGLKIEISDTLPDNSANDTMATDGKMLWVNADFALSLSEQELVGVLAHEVAHPSLGHHVRRKWRDLRDWNIAADLEANPILLQAGFTLPKGFLFESRFVGMSAESIYATLQREKQKQGGQGSGQGKQATSGPQNQSGNPSNGAGQSHGLGCGAIIDAAPQSDGAALAESAAQWERNVRQAVAVAKANNAGNVPSALQPLAKAVNRPLFDIAELVRRFIDNSQSKDYSWSRVNRRFAGQPFVLPGFISSRPNHIVCMIDSSGSMCRDLVAKLTLAVQDALDTGAADKVTIAYADTEVGLHASYGPGDMIDLQGAPRGGTDFAKPFQWISDNCEDASAILYLTDMQTESFGQEPDCPVLWLVTGNPQEAKSWIDRAPFGEPVMVET